MMRVFLTGSSSGLAKAVLPMLCDRGDITQVVGIDKLRCDFRHKKFSSLQLDINSHELSTAMAGSNAVIHLAFAVMRGSMSDAEQYHNNVIGTLNVFEKAKDNAIDKVINISSVSVYGAGLGLDESAPINPSNVFTYAQHKAEIERIASQKYENVIHLRSHLIFGRNCQAFLKAMSNARVFIAPTAPYPVLQVVHEADVARAVGNALTRNVYGAFNLAAPEVTSLPELIKHGGRRVYPLPLKLVRGGVALAKLFGTKDEFTWLDVLDTSITVKCDKAKDFLGWEPEYSAWQAREEMQSIN